MQQGRMHESSHQLRRSVREAWGEKKTMQTMQL
jgi:hypothetical protein